MNLREPQVTEFYTEYWRLRQLYDLHQIYEEIKDDIWSLIDLYRSVRTRIGVRYTCSGCLASELYPSPQPRRLPDNAVTHIPNGLPGLFRVWM